MNEMWSGHDDVSRETCCTEKSPCAFHARYVGAVRSPHIGRDLEPSTCRECAEEIASGPTIDVATS